MTNFYLGYRNNGMGENYQTVMNKYHFSAYASPEDIRKKKLYEVA